MSLNWSSQPLSIKSIASQHKLPVIIRPVLDFHGSNQPIILHSISNITFAYGRILKVHQSRIDRHQSNESINSELVAISLQYPGYFECLQSSSHGSDDGIAPEKNIQSIIEQMKIYHRSQTFYIATPMYVFTLESNDRDVKTRLWHKIEAHQLIIFDKVTYVEYTPTENDNLTPEDFGSSWWFCGSKYILNRTEFVIKCILSNEQICYIPCSSTDDICLIPVGQQGSTNVYKLQTIKNLIEKFSLPINVKLAQLPSSKTYKDFKGNLQLLGSYTDEFALCASLLSTNISFIPVNIPLKFVVASISLLTKEITNQLARCHMLIQSFDMQIRRIIISSSEISSHTSRSKNQFQMKGSRAKSVDPQPIKEQDKKTSINGSSQSELSTEKRRNNFRITRTLSVEESTDPLSRQPIKRTLSTGDNSTYNSLIRPIRTKVVQKQSSLPRAPPLPKKPPNFPHTPTSFTFDTGNNVIQDIDLPNADGAILIDNNNKLFSFLTLDNRS